MYQLTHAAKVQKYRKAVTLRGKKYFKILSDFFLFLQTVIVKLVELFF